MDVCVLLLDRMRDSRPLLVAVLVLAALLVTAPVAAMTGIGTSGGPASATSGSHAQSDSPAPNDSMAPGERVGGVVDVGEAEVDGAVESRALDRALQRADSNAAKATVLAGTVDSIEGRLDELQERKQALEAARENGTISDGRYRAEITAVVARISAIRDLANRTDGAASGLPADVLAANGVNVSAIETLRSRAGNLTGPEVAAIARDVAGDNPGNGFGPPGDRGPPADRPGPGDPGDGAGAGDGAGPGDGGDEAGTPGDGGAGDGEPPTDGGDAETPTAGTPEPPVDDQPDDGNQTTAT